MDDLREQWRGYVAQSQVAYDRADAAYSTLAGAEPPQGEAELRKHATQLEKAEAKRDFARRLLDNAVTQLALLEEAAD